MSYPMWNKSRTGILIDRGNGILAFVDSGHEFDSLSVSCQDWHDAELSTAPGLSIDDLRAQMIASRRQIRLALGEAGCAAMDAAANDLTYPWVIREQMKSAHEWHRTAQEIDEFGWIMGLSADEIDALFVQAMAF